MLVYASIRMKSGDLVVLSPEMNMKWCHGVPEGPGAPADLRVSLVFRHCTKYWIRQLPDKTWEQCKRSASGEDGAWTSLNGSKDGEDEDQEVRLIERRRQAAAKIGEQGRQKRGETKTSNQHQRPDGAERSFKQSSTSQTAAPCEGQDHFPSGKQRH